LIVVDANILVSELLRQRGRPILRRPELELSLPEDQWGEADHEMTMRLERMVTRNRLLPQRVAEIRADMDKTINEHISIVPRALYGHLKEAALRRVPRDARDWAPVALAMAIDAAILTEDSDFLGCGVATWTMATLRAELEQG
jgi:predicted nucleic acid-binding protein